MTKKILAKDANFKLIDREGNRISGFKHYIRDYDQIDFGWKIKRWFRCDINRLREWYLNLEQNYSDWKFIQEKHSYMWEIDPSDPEGKTGHIFMPDTSWYNLCWNPTNVKGPVPPERSNTKVEYREAVDLNELCPRECFNGYLLDICREIENQARIKKVLVSILTPGTVLIKHQDAPDKIRFHIALYTNPNAYWVIDGERLQIPDDGWVYLVNTSLPHEVYNEGLTPSIKIYGKIFTEDVIKLGL